MEICVGFRGGGDGENLYSSEAATSDLSGAKLSFIHTPLFPQ